MEAKTAYLSLYRHYLDLANSAGERLPDVDESLDARNLILRVVGRSAPVTLHLADCVAIEAAAAGGWLLARRSGLERRF